MMSKQGYNPTSIYRKAYSTARQRFGYCATRALEIRARRRISAQMAPLRLGEHEPHTHGAGAQGIEPECG